jgi:hypothetical protein
MLYYIPFSDRKDKAYLIKIISQGNVTDIRYLTPSGSPFSTEMGKSKIIYDPARYSTAEVGIIQDNANDFLQDLYSPTATGTPVELHENPTYNDDGTVKTEGDVVWTGFATPVTYNSDYKSDHDKITLQCVDGLAALQNVKYKAIGDIQASHTFAEIFFQLLSFLGCYKSIYVSAAAHIDSDKAPLFSELTISETNFFDEKQDKDQLDDDLAWTGQQVLEELCRFMGVTAVAFGDSVYLLDFDAIKNGFSDFWKFSDAQTFEKITLQEAMTESQEDYAGTNATISQDEVFNKVVVKASIRSFEDVIPVIFDDLVLKNITTDVDRSIEGPQGQLIKILHLSPAISVPSWVLKDIDGGNIETLMEYGTAGHNDWETYFVAEKFYTSSNYKTYLYKNFGTGRIAWGKVDIPDKFGYDETMAYYGCMLKREMCSQIDKEVAADRNNDSAEDYIKWCSREISTLSFNDDIFFMNTSNDPYWHACDDNHAYDNEYKDYPAFQTTFKGSNAKLFGGKNTYLVISGDFYLGENDDDPFCKERYDWNKKGNPHIPHDWMYVWCRLQWGQHWWNGDSWQGTECDFKLFFGEEKDKKAGDVAYQAQAIRNTVKWWYGLDQSGTAINLSDLTADEILSSDVQFTMFMPMQQYSDDYNKGNHYLHSHFIWLRDFSIKAEVGDPSYSGKNSTDTKYTDVIDSKFATKLDDIEMKVNTFDDKNASYSSVAVNSKGKLTWIDKTVNEGCQSGEKTWTGSDGGNSLRQEEHMVYRIFHQYSTPAVRLSQTLNQYLKPWTLVYEPILNRYMIVDSQSVDFENVSNKVELREHK